MAYAKPITTRARAITPSNTQNIPVINATPATGVDSSITVGGSGEVETATIVNAGLYYATAPTIEVTTATGSGAVLQAVLDTSGSISEVIVIEPGSLYDGSDTLTVTGGTFIADQPCIVYVGGAGTVSVNTEGGDNVIFSGVAAGTILGGASPISIRRVNSTGTSATSLIAMW